MRKVMCVFFFEGLLRILYLIIAGAPCAFGQVHGHLFAARNDGFEKKKGLVTPRPSSQRMLDNAAALPEGAVAPVCADAAEFASGKGGEDGFDSMYCCESVHHFGGPEHRSLVEVLRGLGGRIRVGGRMVVQKVGDEVNGYHGVLPSVRPDKYKVHL